jgi:hypothetical protein
MEKQDINEQVLKTLNEFELMEDIQPSSDWSEALMAKLGGSKSTSVMKIPQAIFTVAVLILILLNIGAFITRLNADAGQILHREKQLQVISSELLFHPISLND